jgi:hypothetical protein
MRDAHEKTLKPTWHNPSWGFGDSNRNGPGQLPIARLTVRIQNRRFTRFTTASLGTDVVDCDTAQLESRSTRANVCPVEGDQKRVAAN